MPWINYYADMIRCQMDIKLYLLFTLEEDRRENIFRYHIMDQHNQKSFLIIWTF